MIKILSSLVAVLALSGCTPTTVDQCLRVELYDKCLKSSQHDSQEPAVAQIIRTECDFRSANQATRRQVDVKSECRRE